MVRPEKPVARKGVFKRMVWREREGRSGRSRGFNTTRDGEGEARRSTGGHSGAEEGVVEVEVDMAIQVVGFDRRGAKELRDVEVGVKGE